MAYIVCVEEQESRWIAHVPDLPGCFATHEDREAAIGAVPSAVEAFVAWCQAHGLRISGLSAPMVVAEVVRSWEYEDGYIVNAFFAADRPPVVEEDLAEYRILLEATMADLRNMVGDLDYAELDKELPGERWPISGVLHHVARSDWWYLDRLGLAFPREELPDDALACLDRVHEHFLASLEQLTKRSGVVTMAGENWSARKVLRRSLWHRRDHTQHIQKLIPLIR